MRPWPPPPVAELCCEAEGQRMLAVGMLIEALGRNPAVETELRAAAEELLGAEGLTCGASDAG